MLFFLFLFSHATLRCTQNQLQRRREHNRRVCRAAEIAKESLSNSDDAIPCFNLFVGHRANLVIPAVILRRIFVLVVVIGPGIVKMQPITFKELDVVTLRIKVREFDFRQIDFAGERIVVEIILLRTLKDNLASSSLLNRQFWQKRITRQRLDSLLKGELEIERYDLITLQFLIDSQKEDEDPRKRCMLYLDHMNEMLTGCGMQAVYPANPYEAFILMCLLTEMPLLTYYDVWEKAYEDPEQ